MATAVAVGRLRPNSSANSVSFASTARRVVKPVKRVRLSRDLSFMSVREMGYLSCSFAQLKDRRIVRTHTHTHTTHEYIHVVRDVKTHKRVSRMIMIFHSVENYTSRGMTTKSSQTLHRKSATYSAIIENIYAHVRAKPE